MGESAERNLADNSSRLCGIGGGIFNCLWIAYFIKSKRVALTFTR